MARIISSIGEHFFRIALERLYGLKSYSIYKDDPASISPHPSSHLKNVIDELRASRELHFVKTHELPEDDSPAVLLIRDGRDAMVSFAHFIQDYGMVRREGLEALFARVDDCKQRYIHGRPPFDQLLRRVIEGEYFDWSAHFRAWRAHRAGCFVVKFESLIREPDQRLQETLTSLGIKPAPREKSLPTFATLHAEDPKFYRAGTTGQWRAEMCSETQELFWRLHGAAMFEAGYEH